MPDSLKALAVVPLILGGAFAVMLLSYLIVPIIVVCSIALVAYTLIKVLKEIDSEEKEKEEK